MKAERDFVVGQVGKIEERLHGMDMATRLLSETVTRVPTAVQEAVAHLKELHGERFDSIAQMFVSRDTAVAAAFDAQKEAAAAQNTANREAIATNQQMTADAIRNLGQLLATNYGAIGEKLDDLKDRVNDRESRGHGGSDAISGQRATVGSLITVGLFVLTVAGFVIALVANNSP